MNEFDKLKRSVNIIVNRKVKENSDDTLCEKLITLIDDYYSDNVKINEQEIIDLIKLLNETFNYYYLDNNQVIDVYSNLRISACLLSNEKIFSIKHSIIDERKNIFINSIINLINKERNDYSLQISYIDSLIKLIKNPNCFEYFFNEQSDAKKLKKFLFELFLESKSHFVQQRCKLLLIKIIQLLNTKNNDIYELIFENDFKSSLILNLLNDLIDNDKENQINFLIDDHNIEKRLIDLYDENFHQLNFSYFNCLSAVITDTNLNVKIIEKLIFHKQLNHLIVYLNCLFKREKNFFSFHQWFTCTIYPLAFIGDKSVDMTDDFLNYLDNNIKIIVDEKISTDTVKCCLSQLNQIYLNKHLNYEQITKVIKIIEKFIFNNHLKLSMKRLVVSSLNCLPYQIKPFTDNHCNQNDNHHLVCDVINIFSCYLNKFDKFLLIIVLRGLRDIFDKLNSKVLVQTEIIKQLCEELNLLLLKAQDNIDESMDEVNSIFEVILNLTKLSNLDYDEKSLIDLFTKIISIWTLIDCEVDSNEYKLTQLIPLSILLIFEINHNYSKESLFNLFNIEKNCTLIKLLGKYLQSNDINIRGSMFTVALKNFDKFKLLLNENIDLFFNEICLKLFKIVLFDVDVEIQSNAIAFSKLLIEEIFIEKDNFEKNLKLFYEHGLFDCVYQCFQRDFTTLKINTEVCELRSQIRKSIFYQISDELFFNLVKNIERKKFLIKQSTVNIISDIVNASVHRDEVLEELFEANGVPRTQILIEKFHLENKSTKDEIYQYLKIYEEPIDIKELFEFFIDEDKHLILFKEPNLCLLDDIIASEDTCNTTTMDCY